MNQRQAKEEIERALDGYQIQALNVLANALGIDRAQNRRKQEVMTALAAHLIDAEALRDRVAALAPAQREALAYLARKGGPVLARSVMAMLRGLVEPAERADALLVDLLKSGLVLYSATAMSWKFDFSSNDPTFQSRLVWTPRAVASLVEQPGTWASLLAPAPEPAVIETGEAGGVLRDIFLVVRAVRTRPLRLTQQGEPHRADLRRLVADVRPHLAGKQWESGIDELLFPLRLCLAAGLVDVDAMVIQVAPLADEVLAANRPSQVARLFAAWQNLDWSELERVESLVIDDYYAGPFGDVPDGERLSRARRVLSEALAEVDEERWDLARQPEPGHPAPRS